MMKNINFIIFLIIAIIVVIGLWWYSLSINKQNINQPVNISQGEVNANTLVDLNSTSEDEILTDPNPSGTVATNYSTLSVPPNQRGKLTFYITDPITNDQIDKTSPNRNRNQNQIMNQNRNQNRNTNQNINSDTQKRSSSFNNANKSKDNQVELASLVLTFSKVQVHLAQSDWIISNNNANLNSNNNNNNTNSNRLAEGEGRDKWEVLNIDTSKEYDLIAMKNAGGALELLGITDLAAGKYTQIRMYVSSAKATTLDGQTIEIEIPGQNNIIKIVRNFTIKAGETTTITVDFDAISSVKKAGDRYILRPVVGKMLVNGKEV